MATDEKAKALEMFDFNHFTVKDLASSVRKSGLYPSDKIIERMEQMFKKQEQILDKRNKLINELIKLLAIKFILFIILTKTVLCSIQSLGLL